MSSESATPSSSSMASKSSSASSSSSSWFQTTLWPLLKLPMCALGICLSYMYYGLFQERLFTKNEDRLGPSFVLVTSCLVNVAVAFFWNAVASSTATTTTTDTTPHQTTTHNDTTTNTTTSIKTLDRRPLHHPWLLLTAGLYVGAMVCSNEAVPYVSYPMVVLAKSCKLIPIMVVGQFVEGKLYQAAEWLAALLISTGIGVFQFSRMYEQAAAASTDNSNDDNDANQQSLYGLILLLSSLLMDGLLASMQNVLKQKHLTVKEQVHRIPNAMETMLYVNLYAVVYLIPWTIVNGQWHEGWTRLYHNDTNTWDVALLQKLAVVNAAAGCGQIFIFLTIAWYSPVMTTTITTTRKFGTILLSVHTFGHVFSNIQWTSIGLVFGGLYLSIWSQNASRNNAASSAKAKQE